MQDAADVMHIPADAFTFDLRQKWNASREEDECVCS